MDGRERHRHAEQVNYPMSVDTMTFLFDKRRKARHRPVKTYERIEALKLRLFPNQQTKVTPIVKASTDHRTVNEYNDERKNELFFEIFFFLFFDISGQRQQHQQQQ